MPSSLLDNLGNMHIVAGTILYASSAPVLAVNDGSASVADTNTGIATVTFGEAFSAAPAVFAQRIKATEAATIVNTVVIDSVTTTGCVVRFKNDAAGTNTTADPADGDGCSFLAVGVRAN